MARRIGVAWFIILAMPAISVSVSDHSEEPVWTVTSMC